MAKRKEYSKEFKEEAVRLAQESGNTSTTARNLGLHLGIFPSSVVSMPKEWATYDENAKEKRRFKYFGLEISAKTARNF